MTYSNVYIIIRINSQELIIPFVIKTEKGQFYAKKLLKHHKKREEE